VAVSHVGDLCRKRVDRREVLFLEAGILVEDLLLSHLVREPAKDVDDGDPHAMDARLSVDKLTPQLGRLLARIPLEFRDSASRVLEVIEPDHVRTLG
jgi:hypothetical protein